MYSTSLLPIHNSKQSLAWSDARGSRFSNNQLVNDLDLEVESPDGTIYLGNDFANGRSTTGGY